MKDEIHESHVILALSEIAALYGFVAVSNFPLFTVSFCPHLSCLRLKSPLITFRATPKSGPLTFTSTASDGCGQEVILFPWPSEMTVLAQ